MRQLKLIPSVMCLLLLSGISFSSWAADANKADGRELLEEVPPPPKVIEGEPMEEPQVTIRKKGTDTIEEYRMNGKLYMMKVTPEGGAPYYLHKNDPEGPWVNDGPTPPLSVPHWIIFRF
ncbi:MAG: DUF2782 domain-containing protein [Methylophilus sp.]|nr:DUF2782 domain-containing protein [Methylophilus sp.]